MESLVLKVPKLEVGGIRAATSVMFIDAMSGTEGKLHLGTETEAVPRYNTPSVSRYIMLLHFENAMFTPCVCYLRLM